jgi:hypothetical protein
MSIHEGMTAQWQHMQQQQFHLPFLPSSKLPALPMAHLQSAASGGCCMGLPACLAALTRFALHTTSQDSTKRQTE